MKNILIILTSLLLIIFANDASSQNRKSFSTIKAQKAFWQVANQNINIAKALKGINTRKELKLVVELQPQTLPKTKNIQKFEMKWYRYGSKGLYLTDSFVETIDISKKKKNEPITIASTRKNLQPGWWIVRIISYNDNGFVTLNGKTQFKIKII